MTSIAPLSRDNTAKVLTRAPDLLSRDDIAKVLAKAWDDPGFLKDLKATPQKALKKLGINTPDGVDIKVLENDASTLHVCSYARTEPGCPNVKHLRNTGKLYHIIIPRREWADSDQADDVADPESRSFVKYVRRFTRGYGDQVRAIRRVISQRRRQ